MLVLLLIARTDFQIILSQVCYEVFQVRHLTKSLQYACAWQRKDGEFGNLTDLCQHPLLFLYGGNIRVSRAPAGACIPHRTYRGPLCVLIPQEVFARKVGVTWQPQTLCFSVLRGFGCSEGPSFRAVQIHSCSACSDRVHVCCCRGSAAPTAAMSPTSLLRRHSCCCFPALKKGTNDPIYKTEIESQT